MIAMHKSSLNARTFFEFVVFSALGAVAIFFALALTLIFALGGDY